MIEGLKPTVPGVKLLELIKSQAEFHQRRAAFYSAEAKKLAELPALESAAKYSNFQDPRQSLAEKVQEHENAAAKLEFIAQYIDLSENYRLDPSDLHLLGVGRGRKTITTTSDLPF